MNSKDHEDATPASPAKGMDLQRMIILALALALVVVIAGMSAWKNSAVSSMQEQLAQAQAKQAQARAELIEQAKQIDAHHAEDALRQFSNPLAWVIRREVMASNLDQVDQYITQLAQLPGFQTAVLARPDGKILVASDRKLLAAPFTSIYPEQYLQASEIKVERSANGNLRSIIPILGLNQQLGTLVVEYTPAPYTLQ